MAGPAYKSPLRRTGTTPRSRARASRRQQRMRLTHLLLPAVWGTAGFVSSELWVRLATGRFERPDVCAASFSFPVDGLAERAPELIVLLGIGDPAAWLAAGASTVWVTGDAEVQVHTADGLALCGLRDMLTLPPPLTPLRVPVAQLVVPDAAR